MENPAPTDVALNDLIKRRWSPRRFSKRPVKDETLVQVLEAARWAPSSFNDQPWNFILAKKEHESQYETLLGCLTEGNRKWARTAPVLMLSVARMNFDYNDKPNRHALHDVGLAVENLVLQAVDEGLFVHQMAGYHADRVREAYRIPAGHEPVAALALGYPPRVEEAAENGAGEPGQRERDPLREFVFSGQWNHASEVLEARDGATRVES